MKQFKTQAPHMACMFFSVDEDACKILCMSCVPEVSALSLTHAVCIVLPHYCGFQRLAYTFLNTLTTVQIDVVP